MNGDRIGIYVDCENTGSHNQFHEKVPVRDNVYCILEHLCDPVGSAKRNGEPRHVSAETRPSCLAATRSAVDDEQNTIYQLTFEREALTALHACVFVRTAAGSVLPREFGGGLDGGHSWRSGGASAQVRLAAAERFHTPFRERDRAYEPGQGVAAGGRCWAVGSIIVRLFVDERTAGVRSS